METIQIDKKSFESLMSKVDEIYKHNTDKTLLRDTIELLEAAIALNVSESTIYQVLNSETIDKRGEPQSIPLKLSESILKRRIRCDVRLIADTKDALMELGTPYKWTGSKSEIIEVIEAILLVGSINNGDVAKKDFYEFIGKVLQIDLSNHNNILDHIYKRKDYLSNNDKRIKYLQKLTNAIARKLQERDYK